MTASNCRMVEPISYGPSFFFAFLIIVVFGNSSLLFATDTLEVNKNFCLNVELTRFEAIVAEEGVVLEWQTGAEYDNKGFEVQRSPDGQHWRGIGFIGGGGTTDRARKYEFVDYPRPGVVFYRLRQINWDGQCNPTPPLTVDTGVGGANNFVQVEPGNGTDREIAVSFPEGLNVVAFYFISDSSGRIVQKGAFQPKKGAVKKVVKASPTLTGDYYITIGSSSFKETFKLAFE